MKLPFWAFWTVALFSNLSAGAQAVAVGWYLGADTLPVAVLTAFQVSGLVGGLAGIAIGARFSTRFGTRRTIAFASIIEAIVCVLVGLSSLPGPGEISDAHGYLVAIVAGAGISFGAGLGGPAWVAQVSRWPGSRNETAQLLRDNAQFQLGRFVGPVIGGVVMAATFYSIQVLSALNAFTFVMVASCMLFVPSRSTSNDGHAPGDRPAALAIFRQPALWGVCALAMAADSSRTFLPRLVRMADQSEVVYTTSVSLIALSAAAGGVLGERLASSDRNLAAIGLFGSAIAIVLWSAADPFWVGLWFAGSISMGLSVAFASAALTALLMKSQPEAYRGRGAAYGQAARTIGGGVGGVLGGLLMVALGGLAFLPVALLPVLAGVALACQPRDHERERTGVGTSFKS